MTCIAQSLRRSNIPILETTVGLLVFQIQRSWSWCGVGRFAIVSILGGCVNFYFQNGDMHCRSNNFNNITLQINDLLKWGYFLLGKS